MDGCTTAEQASLLSYADLRQRAKQIAIDSARKFNPPYFAEPFEPHDWAVAAVMVGLETNLNGS